MSIKYNLSQAIRLALTSGLVLVAASTSAQATVTVTPGNITFNASDLIVTSSYYDGVTTPIVAGSTLLAGATAGTTVKASANSANNFNNVWNNNLTDASFGITSPIFISNVNPTTGNVDSQYNLTALSGGNVVTSFSSKSELALNLSSNGTSVALMAYSSTSGKLDVSNSNTPGLVDSTNPVTGFTANTYRNVTQINADGSIAVTNTNAYSGNNGRSAILDNANGNYYLAGNAGNGNASGTVLTALSNDTGVQTIHAGSSNPNTSVIGAPQGTPGSSTGFQNGFSVTQLGYAADKTGKDDNFRGETVFNGTLYVTKGSGGNGVDTVYQVGKTGDFAAGKLDNTSTITPLPGFPTDLVKTTGGSHTPFGIWFANSTTLYVADEGTGTGVNANTDHGGLEKWSLVGTTWHEDYLLQAGLIGNSYTVSGTTLDGETGQYFTTTASGLRELTGKVNADGTVTLYATTATKSASGDVGADPNQLVAITDSLAATSLPVSESFTTLQTAAYGQVLRGVAFAPVPEPSMLLMMLSGLGLTALARRNKRA